MAVPEIDCATALQMLDAGAAWIDVRGPDAWHDAHISGTVHVPFAAATDIIPREWPDRSSTLVISCTSGSSSAYIVQHLQSLGYSDVHNLRGGIKAWIRDGRPVAHG
jgi:hydroxyacylglutathione hydrolase